MKLPLVLLTLAPLAFLTGCSKTATTETAAPAPPAAAAPGVASALRAEPDPSALPAATPAPDLSAHRADATPAPRELAPAGVFYLVAAVRIETAESVTGLPPGTGVKLLHDNLYLTPAGQAHLRPEQLTNDLAVARAARDADRAAQAATKARLAADAAALAARQHAEATGPNLAQQLPVANPSAPAPAPAPLAPATTPALGSSLSRAQDALNTTHSSTKDKVYTDSIGRKYWRDTQGHAHYF